MATSVVRSGHRSASRLPRALELVGAALAALMLAVVAVSLWKGGGEIASLPPAIAVHLATLIPALALTPVLLVGVKGDRTHRMLGYTWCALLVATAISAWFIRTINDDGALSFVHVFILTTLVGVPRLVANARAHRVAQHRWSVLGMVFGAFLVAGVFAFVGDRHLGIWLFS